MLKTLNAQKNNVNGTTHAVLQVGVKQVTYESKMS